MHRHKIASELFPEPNAVKKHYIPKCSIWTEEKQKDIPAEYDNWLERHKPNCIKSYSGSYQAMEPEVA